MDTAKVHIAGEPGVFVQRCVRCHATLEDIRRYARPDGSVERCFWPVGHFVESDRYGMGLVTTEQSIAYRRCGRYQRPVCVVASYDPPPIPLRNHDWCAYVDGNEERQEYGWGKTREEAVAALFELLAEKEQMFETGCTAAEMKERNVA